MYLKEKKSVKYFITTNPEEMTHHWNGESQTKAFINWVGNFFLSIHEYWFPNELFFHKLGWSFIYNIFWNHIKHNLLQNQSESIIKFGISPVNYGLSDYKNLNKLLHHSCWNNLQPLFKSITTYTILLTKKDKSANHKERCEKKKRQKQNLQLWYVVKIRHWIYCCLNP